MRIHAGHGRLAWNGNGIVDERLDAARGEMRLKRRPIADADHKQMIHVPGIVLRRHVDRGPPASADR